MLGWEHWEWSFWWIFPLFAVLMMVVCMFMMRRAGRMKGGLFHGCCMPHFTSAEKRAPRSSEASAEEIVKTRYARGEISRSEYEEIMRDITKREGN